MTLLVDALPAAAPARRALASAAVGCVRGCGCRVAGLHLHCTCTVTDHVGKVGVVSRKGPCCPG